VLRASLEIVTVAAGPIPLVPLAVVGPLFAVGELALVVWDDESAEAVFVRMLGSFVLLANVADMFMEYLLPFVSSRHPVMGCVPVNGECRHCRRREMQSAHNFIRRFGIHAAHLGTHVGA